MRLLIVEDEKELCDTIAKSLYDVGYEVDTSYNGSEALEYVLTEEYDLIVLDLNLPGIDGMDILRELRRENEETKVLILSARSQIADKVEGLDAGANDYMEKPFHLQALEARRCLPEQWGHKVRYKKARGICKRREGAFDQKRKWNFGISAS